MQDRVIVVYVVILLCNVCVSCKNRACVLSCKIDSIDLTYCDCKLLILNYCHTSITFGDKDGYIRQDGRVLSF